MRVLPITRISDSGIPYAELVVSGKKTWEIRKRNTRIRGRIAIYFNGRVLGTVKIVRVLGPFSPEHLAKYNYHMSTLARMKEYSKGRPLYAWVLEGAERFKKPVAADAKYTNKYDWARVDERLLMKKVNDR